MCDIQDQQRWFFQVSHKEITVVFLDKNVGGMSRKYSKSTERIAVDCIKPFEIFDTTANKAERGGHR